MVSLVSVNCSVGMWSTCSAACSGLFRSEECGSQVIVLDSFSLYMSKLFSSKLYIVAGFIFL